jgi:hypothetical protein
VNTKRRAMQNLKQHTVHTVKMENYRPADAVLVRSTKGLLAMKQGICTLTPSCRICTLRILQLKTGFSPQNNGRDTQKNDKERYLKYTSLQTGAYKYIYIYRASLYIFHNLKLYN